MALFNNFPWTNFHELNLDWIVKQVKEIQAAFPEGLVGIPKGGTGADNAADARANLGIYASEIDMAPDDSRVISLVMGYLQDQIDAVTENVNYRIFKTVQDLGLTPGSVSLTSTWTAMSAGDILICPPDDLAPGACPESYGTLLLIRSGGNSGSCLFLGENHQYRKNFVNNYPSGSWEQIYTDADIVPITNGGTGADNATDAIQNLGIDFSGTVLSVAGVGADPTGNVPLTANDLHVGMKLYTSITDLGLPVGSTLSAVWTALPAESRIVFPRSEISDPPVSEAGVIDIAKTGPNNNLGWIHFYGQQASTGNYEMFLTSAGIPSGSWYSNDPYFEDLTSQCTFPKGTPGHFACVRYGKIVLVDYQGPSTTYATQDNLVVLPVSLGGVSSSQLHAPFTLDNVGTGTVVLNLNTINIGFMPSATGNHRLYFQMFLTIE